MEKIDTQSLQSQTHQIAGKEIEMLSNPEVWSPYSASEMLAYLNEKDFLNDLKGESVLDVGTGSGIIGIFCGLLGASNVILSDYSLPAVKLAQENARINGLQVAGIQSDRFESFKGQKFDKIISNPPVQPWLFTNQKNIENRNNGAAWNEAGNDGRLVLDALIIEGKKHLEKKGDMIISCSSRHGHRRTTELFNQYWGENQWKIILEVEHEIDANYHKPYVPSWLFFQSIDADLRIYQKDIHNKKYAIQKDKDGNDLILAEIDWQGKKQVFKLIPEANGYFLESISGERIASLPKTDVRLPQINSANPWLYTYFLIQSFK